MRSVKQIRGHHCPVCGFHLEVFEFNICPSCGTEFGIDDIDHSYTELRHIWIENGPHWSSTVSMVPERWNPWMQLIEAGLVYDLPFHYRIEFVARPVNPAAELIGPNQSLRMVAG
jgi:hypothetical protein